VGALGLEAGGGVRVGFGVVAEAEAVEVAGAGAFEEGGEVAVGLGFEGVEAGGGPGLDEDGDAGVDGGPDAEVGAGGGAVWAGEDLGADGKPALPQGILHGGAPGKRKINEE
jgi:hypothetical protein